MKYIHIKNLEFYHPGYKDRDLKWFKCYFKMVNADPEFEMLCEIDKWRFVAFVMLELQYQKPLPLDEAYWKRKGFDLKKRSMSLTIKMLHNSIEVVTEDEIPCSDSVTQSKSKIREEKKKNESFVPPTLQEITDYAKQRNSPLEPKVFFEFFDVAKWVDSKGNKVKNWKQKFITWESRQPKKDNQNTGRHIPGPDERK